MSLVCIHLQLRYFTDCIALQEALGTDQHRSVIVQLKSQINIRQPKDDEFVDHSTPTYSGKSIVNKAERSVQVQEAGVTQSYLLYDSRGLN